MERSAKLFTMLESTPRFEEEVVEATDLMSCEVVVLGAVLGAVDDNRGGGAVKSDEELVGEAGGSYPSSYVKRPSRSIIRRSYLHCSLSSASKLLCSRITAAEGTDQDGAVSVNSPRAILNATVSISPVILLGKSGP